MILLDSYINAVTNGEIIVNQYVKQAIERELSDRQKSKDKNFPYYYNAEMANKAVAFLNLVPSPTGEPIKLSKFQEFIIYSIFGWRKKKDDTRRYTTAFISMARKNGKSFLASAIALLALLMEKQPATGKQILFTANSLEQAMLSFDMAKTELNRMMVESPALRNRNIKLNQRMIIDQSTDSYMQALPADANRLDGRNPLVAIVDEYHASTNRDVINVLKTGQMQQSNPLLFIISTTGFNARGPMKEDWDLYTKVLNNEIEMDDTFILLYCLDQPTEVEDRKNWIKANPLFEVDAVREKMESKLKNDYDNAVLQGEERNFLVKNCNLWYQDQKSGFIPENVWDKAIRTDIDITGRQAIIGIDLSMKNDLTSVSWSVILDENKVYCDSFSFVGDFENIVEKSKRENINYEALERAGECSISKLETGSVNYDDVYEFVADLIEKNQLKDVVICYDPYNSGFIIDKLAKDYTCVEIRQRALEFSPSISEFKEFIRDGKIYVSDKELLKIANHNAIVQFNSSGLKYIDKAKNVNKIDPLMALLDGYIYVKNNKLNQDHIVYDDDYFANYKF